jgi:hypothetical protein
MEQRPISEQIINSPVAQSISEGTQNIGTGISNTYNSVSSALNDFSSKSLVTNSNEFLQSNSIIAKFVFIILVMVIFLVLLNLGISLITYFSQPSTSPYVVKGLLNGNQFLDISQDPKKSNSVTIYRSNNQTTGIEFTWSVWLNINAVGNTSNGNTSKYQHIFSKGGNNNYDPTTGLMLVNNAPGVYLAPQESTGYKTNNLHIVMSTNSNVGSNSSLQETVDVEDAPLNTWFNLVIRLENKVMDVYINGTIKKRISFNNVPMQNYDDVFVCGNGGFNGNLSNLRYYDRALNIFEINTIALSGPNLTVSNPAVIQNKFDYLSGIWYYGN